MQWSAHISWLFLERPYRERVGAAHAAGFRWIETAWPQPAEREELPMLLAAHGVGVALLNCPEGELERGERGLLADPARREDATRGFLAASALARRLSAVNLNMLVGKTPDGVTGARALADVRDALREFAAEAGDRGQRLLLEPLNERENPGYLLPTADAAASLVEACGSDALCVLLDVHHVVHAGGDPLLAIARCAGLIGHVQISDHPGRGEPGSGSLQLESILLALQDTGYDGTVGLEYTPTQGTVESLAFMREALAPAVPAE